MGFLSSFGWVRLQVAFFTKASRVSSNTVKGSQLIAWRCLIAARRPPIASAPSPKLCLSHTMYRSMALFEQGTACIPMSEQKFTKLCWA